MELKNSVDVVDIFDRLVGKSSENKDGTFLPLNEHHKDAAAVMEMLIENRVPKNIVDAAGLEREAFRKVGIFLTMIHDIGKCTPAFQSKILQELPHIRELIGRKGLELNCGETLKHAMAGEVILRYLKCPEGICAIVGAHHGKPSTDGDQTYDITLHIGKKPFAYFGQQKDLWEAFWRQILENALTVSGYGNLTELPELSYSAQVLLCGLLIEADWLASNQEFFPTVLSDNEIYDSERFSLQFRASAIAKIGLPKMWRADQMTAFDFSSRFGFAPNAVQCAVIECTENMKVSGLMIIEAPMGVGKTEAGLGAAEIMAGKFCCGGLYFGLPTQATSNGIFPRLAQWAKGVSGDDSHAIRLAHGMAELNDEYQAFRQAELSDEDEESKLIAHSWFAGKKQALLADFVVGTVDTAIMAALRQKHVMLRHLGLSGKVVIIDECHAYDAHMSRYLERTLAWLGAYEVPVILLSATLPKEKKMKLLAAYCKPYSINPKIQLPETDGYPLITCTNGENVSATSVEVCTKTSVTIERRDETEVAALLRDRLSSGGCAGVIVNTVKRAQEFAQILREAMPDKKVLVYHAQFAATDRIAREKEIADLIGKQSTPEQRNNVIVVGTQVLEQSLDIDFDFLVTDLCPMDLLLQRIGRLHRHKRPRPGNLAEPVCVVLGALKEEEKYIFNDSSKLIYSEWLLQQTCRYLPEKIELPKEIPQLVNSVYEMTDYEKEHDSACKEYESRISKAEGQAESWLLKRPKQAKRARSNSIRSNSMVAMLDGYIESEQKAEASVRGGTPSVEVLVMCQYDEEHMGPLPWMGDMRLRCDTVPSAEEARMVAKQRLRLPFVFSAGKNLDDTIETLERENQRLLRQWQQSPWLKGELILVLNKDMERNLCGYHLKYQQENGLHYERIGE